MTQDTDDAHESSEPYDVMLSIPEAARRVHALRRSTLATRPTETVPLAECGGRTLAADVVADADQPPHSHATMDGFAFDATEEYPLRLRDSSVFPEDEPSDIGEREAVRIATGAPLPAGANAVLKREEATVTEEGGEEYLDGPTLSPWTYVYRRGSNVSAGETLFAAGERLSAKDTILLRDLGHESVEVHERLSVALLATGTEIHEGRHTDLDSPMLAALVRAWGHEATYEGSVPDDYETVRDRVSELADGYDVVVTTGGTSVGKKDYAIRALAELGDVLFHRVRIRPGKPIAVADLGDAVAFAIPGKPVGAHAVTTLVARPFFVGKTRRPTVTATLSRGFDIGVEGFDYVVPVTLSGDDEALPLGHVDSPLTVYDETFDPSVLSSSTRATRADGFVVTDSGIEAGTSVEVVPYDVVER
nr:molybdopterin molybdotransferase MoeA [Salinigranum halophilum]